MSEAPAPSRPPAPDVPPVEHLGIRYSQVMNGRARNLDQPTGYLMAEDTATGEEIWVLKVYDVKTDPALERDVQEIYFSSMTLDAESNSLLIEREFGGTLKVDLETLTVETQTD